MLNFMQRLFRTTSKPRIIPRPPRRASLQVEGLEDSLVPTHSR
jgi:hypothetical protein